MADTAGGVPEWADKITHDDCRKVSSSILRDAFATLDSIEFYLDKIPKTDLATDTAETVQISISRLHAVREDLVFFGSDRFALLVAALDFHWRESDSVRENYFKRARPASQALSARLWELAPVELERSIASRARYWSEGRRA